MNEGQRPSPDELLSQIEAEEKKAHRGKLKIFFGSSAGVGKTYSMLSAAHEIRKQGIDVMVGIIETHGRPHTETLLRDLPILPPLAIPYHGLTVKELDLNKALERKPHTILVDELAHTNAPGSRHPKRWNDVLELLEAGINVFTTLNVQHIESLSDLVAGSTGVWVKETVPDSVFDMADDIVLVDIDTDDLLKRLHEGNVYIAPDANKRAAENFFKKENLNALREIALRRTAERVDAERDTLHEGLGRLPVAEKLLVCIAPDETAAKLIRATKRIASALKAPWTALYVERGDPRSHSNNERRRTIEVLERMVSRLDGKLITLHGDDILDEVLSYARKHNITKIVVGKDYHFSLRSFFNSWLVDRLIRYSKSIDIIVITEDQNVERKTYTRSTLADLRPFNYVIALLAVACLTVPGFVMPDLLTRTDQALLYLVGVVMVADSLGFGPSLFYTFMAAISFSVFFVTQHPFHVTEERAYFMTFLVMLVTGSAIARQSSRLKRQAISARDKQTKTHALYELTRKLSSTRGRFPEAEVVCNYLSKIHDVDLSVWMTNAEGHPAVILGNLPEDTYYKDFGALQWCYDNAKNAGRGTTTLPNAAGFYIALVAGEGTLGVLGVYPKAPERLFTFDEIASMETLASLLASALERVRAGEIAQQMVVEKENKRLRDSLISAFSINDLGQTETSFTPSDPLINQPSAQSSVDISQMIDKEAKSFKKTVMKMMDANILSTGSVQTNRVPSSIPDRVEHALIRMGFQATANHTIKIDIPTNLPDALIDETLVEQLFSNLIENALHHAPAHSTITIKAQRIEGEILLSVTDKGPGFPPHIIGNLLDHTDLHAPDPLSGEKGLGLVICAGIVRLHDGRLWAENDPDGGARVSLTLPLA